MASLAHSATFSPESKADDQAGERLGRLLRDAREQRGLTLEQAANELKIPAQRLAAFERHGIPPGESVFYARAQLRAYARAVGLDDGVVRAELGGGLAPSAPAVPPVEAPKAGRAGLRRIVIAVGSAIVLVLIGQMIATRERPPALEPSSPGPSVAPLEQPLPPVEIGPGQATPTTGLNEQVQETPSGESQANGRQLLEVSSPALPVAPVTELVIRTEPEGARVTVNGVGWGTTPVTIRHLEPGPKRVRVTKDGYTAVERVVSVATDRPRLLDIRLQPASQ
jgi:cytoskeleton protein RodZ